MGTKWGVSPRWVPEGGEKHVFSCMYAEPGPGVPASLLSSTRTHQDRRLALTELTPFATNLTDEESTKPGAAVARETQSFQEGIRTFPAPGGQV